MVGKKQTEPEVYQCPDCGYKTAIQRPTGRKKKVGHLKWMWCVRCKATTNHTMVP